MLNLVKGTIGANKYHMIVMFIVLIMIWLLLHVFNQPTKIINLRGLLFSSSHLFVVLILVLWVGLWKFN
jgi:hypothetical protein